GFPFSKLDENWNFIGKENQAGRFRTFIGLDVKIQYQFDFKFRGRRFQFRAGLSVIDVLNYSNPRDVQEHVSSPNYGRFYNPVGGFFASTVISTSNMKVVAKPLCLLIAVDFTHNPSRRCWRD